MKRNFVVFFIVFLILTSCSIVNKLKHSEAKNSTPSDSSKVEQVSAAGNNVTVSDSSAEKSVRLSVSNAGAKKDTNSIKPVSKEVKWYSIQEAEKLNKTAPRKIMIDVYTDWCGWCKVLDKNTFQNDTIAAYLNRKYYPVKLNAEQRDSIVFQDRSYKFVPQGTRGYNELAATLLGGQMSYPSVVFLDEKFQGIYISKGYVEAKNFDMILKYIGGDFYNTVAWDVWSAGYQSPIVQ
jgi:thioredoxin-related protein